MLFIIPKSNEGRVTTRTRKDHKSFPNSTFEQKTFFPKRTIDKYQQPTTQ